jgi:hypothetical protein
VTAALPVLERDLTLEHPEVAAAHKVHEYLRLNERATLGPPIGERALASARRAWGADHPLTAAAELIVAKGEVLANKPFLAADRYPSIVARLEAGYGPHPLLALALHAWAVQRLRAGDEPRAAEPHARRAVETYRATYPGEGGSLVATLVETLVLDGRADAAERLAEDADAGLSRRSRRSLASHIAGLYERLGEFGAAVRWGQRAHDTTDQPKRRKAWAEAVARWRARS